jgi:hypothetical protein
MRNAARNRRPASEKISFGKKAQRREKELINCWDNSLPFAGGTA